MPTPPSEPGNRLMEYVEQRGSSDHLPLDSITADLAAVYGEQSGQDAPSGADQLADEAFHRSHDRCRSSGHQPPRRLRFHFVVRRHTGRRNRWARFV
ncbi:MAG: hypothetical protein WBM50_28475 [Acidimicrobiales bacterium]